MEEFETLEEIEAYDVNNLPIIFKMSIDGELTPEIDETNLIAIRFHTKEAIDIFCENTTYRHNKCYIDEHCEYEFEVGHMYRRYKNFPIVSGVPEWSVDKECLRVFIYDPDEYSDEKNDEIEHRFTVANHDNEQHIRTFADYESCIRFIKDNNYFHVIGIR